MKVDLNKKYNLSIYVYVASKNDVTIICNTGYGTHLKMSFECWNTIEKYIVSYTPAEICDAAHEEDREYYVQLFKNLIDKKILVQDEEWLDTVDLALTNRCNLQCTHCAVTADKISGVEFLATEEWKEIIDKVLAVNPNLLVLTGGEPMIRIDFFDLVDYIRKSYTGKLELMTNGLLINNENVNSIVRSFDCLAISLDGYDEETCAAIRGPGVFQKVMDVIELLIAHGFNRDRISLSMVETSVTYGKVYKFRELCDSLGVGCMPRIFSAIGRGKDNSDWLTPKTEEIQTGQEFGDTALKIKNPGNRQIAIPCRNCRAGRGKISINAKGDVFPCQLLEDEAYCFGSILLQDDLYFLVKGNHETFSYRRLTNEKGTECENCDVNAFCKYCVAVEHYDENINKCKSRKRFLSRMIWGNS